MIEKRKTAFVLSGGGARGAYEIGVWQALRELGIRIDMVFGTSVGAINGAMICQDEFDLSVSIWKEIKTDMVFDLKEGDLLNYFKEFFSKGGASSSGLKNILQKYVDESVIRQSQIEYGIVTMEIPSMTPHYLMRDQIPQGKLIDYILASAACFPAVKSYEIDEKKYVDGGYLDNLPIKMALAEGATHIIAVDLEAIGMKLAIDQKDLDKIKTVKSNWDLGNILIFDIKNSQKIMRLGFLDTLKSYGVYDGGYYSFVKGEFDKRSLKAADIAGRIFDLNMEIIYLKSTFNRILYDAIVEHNQETATIFSLSSSSSSIAGKVLDNLKKAKTTFSQKSITLAIANSLNKSNDDKNIFLSKPAIKLFKEELLAANYIVKEGLYPF